MLWPFFEGNQRSIKCIAAYIESFPCGKPAGYKLESQRCNKVIFQVQGHVSCAKHGFIPHCRYIKWRPETHFISAKDVHFIESYTPGIRLTHSDGHISTSLLVRPSLPDLHQLVHRRLQLYCTTLGRTWRAADPSTSKCVTWAGMKPLQVKQLPLCSSDL